MQEKLATIQMSGPKKLTSYYSYKQTTDNLPELNILLQAIVFHGAACFVTHLYFLLLFGSANPVRRLKNHCTDTIVKIQFFRLAKLKEET
jgi:hypothetical protein